MGGWVQPGLAVWPGTGDGRARGWAPGLTRRLGLPSPGHALASTCSDMQEAGLGAPHGDFVPRCPPGTPQMSSAAGHVGGLDAGSVSSTWTGASGWCWGSLSHEPCMKWSPWSPCLVPMPTWPQWSPIPCPGSHHRVLLPGYPCTWPAPQHPPRKPWATH